MQCGADQSAHTRDEAGVLNSAGSVKQFRRDRTHFLVLQRFNDVLNPIPLSGFNVVVEKNYPFAACRFCAGVAFRGEVERGIECDKAKLTADRFGYAAEPLDQFGAGHDDELGVRVIGRGWQIASAFLRACE